jgi:hypothetical protein
MHTMKNALCLVFFLMLWAACKKEDLPPGGTGTPVFKVQYTTPGAVNNSVTAGVSDAYLFTDFHTDNQNIIVCSGTFAATTCPAGNCPGSLGFEFSTVPAGTAFSPDSVFAPGILNYKIIDPPSDTFFRTTFTPVNPAGFNAFVWNVNGQSTAQGDTFVYDSPSLSPLTVELRAQNGQGLTSIVERTISLTNPGELYPSVDIQVDNDSLIYILTALSSGTQVISTMWNTGDTTAGFMTDLLSDEYRVTVTDDFQSTASATLEQPSTDDLPLRTVNFIYFTTPVLLPGANGAVSIQWVDDQGIIWRSDRNLQPPGSAFQVLESMPYDPNENGRKTRKMRVSFQCKLFNDDGESRDFSGTGVIAVAYP